MIGPAIGGERRAAIIGAAIGRGHRGAGGERRRAAIGGGRASGRKAIGHVPPCERSRCDRKWNDHCWSLFVRALPDFSLYPGRGQNGPADTTPVALHQPTKTRWQWSDERGLIQKLHKSPFLTF
jgi:hypothetical protein